MRDAAIDCSNYRYFLGAPVAREEDVDIDQARGDQQHL